MESTSGAVAGQSGTREALDRCIRRAIEAFDAAHNVRVPRSEDLRRHEFAAWLADIRAQLRPIVEEALREELVDTGLAPGSDTELGFLEQQLWRQAEEDFRRWAIRGLAVAWVSRNLSIATILGLPERLVGGGWTVPITVRGYGEDLGQVVFDPDGNVLLDRTTSSEELLDHLDGRAGTPAPTTAGQ